MSNFWSLSDGKMPEKKSSYDANTGFDVIPKDTTVLALVDEAGWKAGFEGEPDLISIRWTVLAPEAYKNRKIFQKLKVLDEKESTRDNAKKMLMAIDTNAGGKLAKLESEPEDDQLMAALMNKQMVLKLAVWEMNDKTGNWVCAVSPKNAAGTRATKKVDPAEQAMAASAADSSLLEDDTIPF